MDTPASLMEIPDTIYVERVGGETEFRCDFKDIVTREPLLRIKNVGGFRKPEAVISCPKGAPLARLSAFKRSLTSKESFDFCFDGSVVGSVCGPAANQIEVVLTRDLKIGDAAYKVKRVNLLGLFMTSPELHKGIARVGKSSKDGENFTVYFEPGVCTHMDKFRLLVCFYALVTARE